MSEKEAKKEEAAPEKKGRGMLFGIIAVILLGIGAAGFIFLKDRSGDKVEKAGHQEAEAPHGGGHEGAKSGERGSMFALEPFIVNLQDNSGTRYLKLTVNLELNPNSNTSELTAMAPQIRDSLIILLSSKGYTDIGTVEGKYQMRDEIVARINQLIGKTRVKTAYFTEFVIQ